MYKHHFVLIDNRDGHKKKSDLRTARMNLTGIVWRVMIDSQTVDFPTCNEICIIIYALIARPV